MFRVCLAFLSLAMADLLFEAKDSFSLTNVGHGITRACGGF